MTLGPGDDVVRSNTENFINDKINLNFINISFVDAIIEGIGNVVLFIIGVFLIFLDLAIIMFSFGNVFFIIFGFVILIVGMGMVAAKYRRR